MVAESFGSQSWADVADVVSATKKHSLPAAVPTSVRGVGELVSPGHVARKQYRPGASGDPGVFTASETAEASPAGGEESARALTPAAVPPVVHRSVELGSVGPHRKNDTSPVGVGGVPEPEPWTTAVSV